MVVVGLARTTRLQAIDKSLPSGWARQRHVTQQLEDEGIGLQPTLRRAEGYIGFDPAAFHTVLGLREGKGTMRELNHEEAFGAYLDTVTGVAEKMDRLLASESLQTIS